jgi:hypothetical protein
MKQISIILMAFMLVFSGCKKDEETDEPEKLSPTADVKGFAIEWTSITCSICGSKGGPLLNQYAKDAPHGAIIALHVNTPDSMKIENDVHWGFAEDRPSGGGIPSFWVGDTKTTTQDDNAVKDQINSGNAVAGVDMKYKTSGSTMTVETLTKFFAQADGDYYLSVYVLELMAQLLHHKDMCKLVGLVHIQMMIISIIMFIELLQPL